MCSFNVRVYGLLIRPSGQILLSHERIQRKWCVKFPGGGLQFGEGTKECLQREMLEEAQLHVSVDSHFYTTDFCQISAFNSHEQLIAIYYYISTKQTDAELAAHLNCQATNQSEVYFEVKNFHDTDESIFAFPVDRHVFRLLTHR